MDITIDQYPYIAGSTGLHAFMPAFVLEGGYDSLKHRLSQPRIHDTVKQIMIKSFVKDGYVSISHWVVSTSPDSTYNGKSISLISRMKSRDVKLETDIETLFELLNLGPSRAVFYTMSEKDVVNIMKCSYNMIALDGRVEPETGIDLTHPRSFGTNARVLSRYVREQKVLSLEEAVQRMTTLPAKRFNIKDRGQLKEGMWADIVVFNRNKIKDNGTYENPKRYSTGFQYVCVNGTVVVENDQHNGSKPGSVIYGGGDNR